MEMKPGFLAKSLAGNDKGMIYVIKEDCGEYIILLGQDERQLRKNKKHVQLIKRTEVKRKVCQKQM